MKFIIVNAFSINMLARLGQDIARAPILPIRHSAQPTATPRLGQDIAFVPISADAAANLIRNERAECAIGHADTARVVAGVLGMPERGDEWATIAETRPNVLLDRNTSLIVAQYSGPRLPAGAVTLPEGARIEFWQVYHVG